MISRHKRIATKMHISNRILETIACLLIIAAFGTTLNARPQCAQDQKEATSPEKQPAEERSGAASQGGIEILSDTLGFDFGPYMQRLRRTIQVHWDPLVPKVARPPVNKSGTVKIELFIMRDGQVKGIKIVESSGDLRLDQAAWRGVVDAVPLPRLPNEFKGDSLRIRCNFFYNSRPSAQQESKPGMKK